MHTAVFITHYNIYSIIFLNAASYTSITPQVTHLGIILMFWLHMLGSGTNYYTDGISNVPVNTMLELKINE